MLTLPKTDETPLIRTHFGDDAAWAALRSAVETPSEEEFLADVTIVEDERFAGATPEEVYTAAEGATLVVVADETAQTGEGLPLLVLYCDPLDEDDELRQLRVVAAQLWAVENNISQVNMDWDDFAEDADEDGVYRGF